MSNHNIKECKKCLRRRRSRCEVFVDKNNVILDAEGCCNAAIYDQEELEKIEMGIKQYAIKL